MSPVPTCVISDFGGVLTLPLDEAFLAYQQESGVSAAELGRAMAAAMEAAGGANPLFELEKGAITYEEFLRRLEAFLPGGQKLEGFGERFMGQLEPNFGMIDRMRELRASGRRMALLTNNVREWEPLWRAKLPDIDEIFEVIVDSAFVGMRKPEPEIYELTLERLGAEAGECLFLDDLEVNCATARELGMTVIRFVDTDQALADIAAALEPASS